jgi:hypothetical protein
VIRRSHQRLAVLRDLLIRDEQRQRSPITPPQLRFDGPTNSPPAEESVPIADVVATASAHFGLRPKALTERWTGLERRLPRNIVMHLARSLR